MPHVEGLTEIAVVVLFALGGGLVLSYFKKPAIIGYIVAGALLGPSGFSIIQNREAVSSLAELGVLLLLFLIGVELNLRSFRETWLATLSCVLLQVLGCLGLVFFVGYAFAWSFGTVCLLSFILALSSTAVSIKLLEEIGELKTETGRLTISILIAQDLIFVPMILALRALGDGGFEWLMILKVFLAMGLLFVFIYYLSRKERLHIPYLAEATFNRDLMPLLGLAFCFGAAALSGLFGLSAAYGAFLAGLFLGNSAERHEIIEVTHPIQTVLVMVFFLSIGLLVDVVFIWHNIGKIAILLLILFFAKTGLNVLILRMLRQPLAFSFLSSLILAQIGEFSFVLATTGRDMHLINEEGYKLVISLTVMSLVFSPVWMECSRKLQENDAPCPDKNPIGSFYFRIKEKLLHYVRKGV